MDLWGPRVNIGPTWLMTITSESRSKLESCSASLEMSRAEAGLTHGLLQFATQGLKWKTGHNKDNNEPKITELLRALTFSPHSSVNTRKKGRSSKKS